MGKGNHNIKILCFVTHGPSVIQTRVKQLLPPSFLDVEVTHLFLGHTFLKNWHGRFSNQVSHHSWLWPYKKSLREIAGKRESKCHKKNNTILNTRINQVPRKSSCNNINNSCQRVFLQQLTKPRSQTMTNQSLEDMNNSHLSLSVTWLRCHGTW